MLHPSGCTSRRCCCPDVDNGYFPEVWKDSFPRCCRACCLLEDSNRCCTLLALSPEGRFTVSLQPNNCFGKVSNDSLGRNYFFPGRVGCCFQNTCVIPRKHVCQETIVERPGGCVWNGFAKAFSRALVALREVAYFQTP